VINFIGTEPVDEAELERLRAVHEDYLTKHATWDAIATSIREERDELDEGLRAQAIDALAFVRREFDEAWPRRFFVSDARVASFLLNQAAWTSTMLVMLARDIQSARGAPGWQTVRRRLMDPATADPALLQLELGARALERGLELYFEPPGRKAQRADLRLQSDSTVMNVECTSIQAFPEASDEAGRISHTICPAVHVLDLGLYVGGTVTGPFTHEDLEDVAAQASEFYRRCSATNRPGEFAVPNTVSIWATPINHPRAQAFIDAHGGEVTFSVDFQHDPLARLVATIERKARGGQLLHDTPALLVVEPSRLLTQVHIAAIRSGVCRTLDAHPHINAVALIHRHLGERPDALIELSNSDFATVRTLYRPIQEDVVVVRNPARVHPDGDVLLDRLFGPREHDDRPA
jgi:hypothetical protein